MTKILDIPNISGAWWVGGRICAAALLTPPSAGGWDRQVAPSRSIGMPARVKCSLEAGAAHRQHQARDPDTDAAEGHPEVCGRLGARHQLGEKQKQRQQGQCMRRPLPTEKLFSG